MPPTPWEDHFSSEAILKGDLIHNADSQLLSLGIPRAVKDIGYICLPPKNFSGRTPSVWRHRFKSDIFNITNKLGLCVKSQFIYIVTLDHYYSELRAIFHLPSTRWGLYVTWSYPWHYGTHFSVRLPSFRCLLQFQLGPHCKDKKWAEYPLGIEGYNTPIRIPLDDLPLKCLFAPNRNSDPGPPYIHSHCKIYHHLCFAVKEKLDQI